MMKRLHGGNQCSSCRTHGRSVRRASEAYSGAQTVITSQNAGQEPLATSCGDAGGADYDPAREIAQKVKEEPARRLPLPPATRQAVTIHTPTAIRKQWA